MKRFNFVHHRFINGQAAGGVHHQHIVEMLFGIIHRRAGDVHRLLAGIRREKIHAHLFGQ